MNIQKSPNLVICGALSFIKQEEEYLGTIGPIILCHYIKLPSAALLPAHDETGLMLFKRQAFPNVDGL